MMAFFKDLFNEKTRIILTILAVAWGTASIAIMLAVGNGLRVMFSHSMDGVGKNIMIVMGDSTKLSYHGIPQNWQINLTQQSLNVLRKAKLPDVSEIIPEYSQNVTLRFNKQKYPTQISGIGVKYQSLRNLTVEPGGRLINPIDIKNHSWVIVVGSQVVKQLFKSNVNPVGQTLTLNNKPFTIIGVLKQKMQTFSYQTPDNYMAFIPASTFAQVFNTNTISDIIFKLSSTKNSTALGNEIRKIIAINHGASPNDPGIIWIANPAATQTKTNQFFFGMEVFLGIIGALTLIVAGVGIANVMYVSVSKATHEIGLRMALGARDYQILKHYIFEALTATAIGGIIGLVFAKSIVLVMSLIPLHGKIFQFIGKPVPVLSTTVVIIVITILGIIGFLAGYFPAKNAANIDPAEALRHE